MNNLELYEAVRKVPAEAQRAIAGGRLKGKTDINPMWRLKTLTERFGPCGIGWKYVIEKQWTEAGNGGEISAFCNISLYIKYEGLWSDAIPGTGGSEFVAKETSGLYTSDECYKMALTDAISVACKALGIGADVYWAADSTKYDRPTENKPKSPAIPAPPPTGPLICEGCGKPIVDGKKKSGVLFPAADIAASSQRRFGKLLCLDCAVGNSNGS